MGNSLLHVAAQVNDADLILQLLELGADPSATNSRGDTFQASLLSGSDARLNAAGRKSRQQVRDWLAAHGIAVQYRQERNTRRRHAPPACPRRASSRKESRMNASTGMYSPSSSTTTGGFAEIARAQLCTPVTNAHL